MFCCCVILQNDIQSYIMETVGCLGPWEGELDNSSCKTGQVEIIFSLLPRQDDTWAGSVPAGGGSQEAGAAELEGDRQGDGLSPALSVQNLPTVPGNLREELFSWRSNNAQHHSVKVRGDHQTRELCLSSHLLHLRGWWGDGTFPGILFSLALGSQPVSGLSCL